MILAASVASGWTAVAISALFGAVVGPKFRDLILRNEDAWIDPAEGLRPSARANSSTGLSAGARRRA